MARSTQIIWWVGLAGALVATLVILKEVALVLRTLQQILRLAEITREAARGIADNVSAISKLEGLGEPVGVLHEAVATLAGATASIERKLSLPVGGRG
ncbi:MAG: hypothetical protein HY329_11335 [Chloroflexi bacterium]|nr:hypothetical protein [Chloroflexota bacterium]